MRACLKKKLEQLDEFSSVVNRRTHTRTNAPHTYTRLKTHTHAHAHAHANTHARAHAHAAGALAELIGWPLGAYFLHSFVEGF